MNPVDLSPVKRVIVLIGLAMASLMLTLDYTIANVSIPYIAGDLGVSMTQGTYLITLFAVGNAIALPISGRLTERFGSLRTFLFSIVAFTFFSWMCGMADSYMLLLIARFFQGFSAGPIIPIGQSILLATHPRNKRNTALALWSIVIVVGPILGPILGGYISVNFGWPWIFYVNLPIGALSFFLSWLFLRKHAKKGVKTKLDLISFLLLAIGVTTLQIFLDKGEEWDWFSSSKTSILAIVCFISFVYLIIKLRSEDKPLIDLSLYKNLSFSLSLILCSLTIGVYIGSVILVPLWLQTFMGYDAIWAGLAVAPVGLASLLFGKFVGKMIDKFGKRLLLLICFLLFACANFYTSFFAVNIDIQNIWTSRFLTGMGLVFFFTPMMALSLQDLKYHQHAMANGIFHFHRTLAMGIGTSLFTSIWTRRTTFHYERIVSTVSQINLGSYFSDAKGVDLPQMFGLVAKEASKQASVMALNDCFWMMAWLFIAMTLLLPIGAKRGTEPAVVISEPIH